nr:hypothetical protein [Actinomycetota bacterium]
MVTVPVDRLVSALRELGPAERALLSLSLAHRLSDEELGEVTALEPSAVAERRAMALDRLAELSLGRGDALERKLVEEALAALSDDDWRAASTPRRRRRPKAARRRAVDERATAARLAARQPD